MFLSFSSAAVSYTHLDVYKRQQDPYSYEITVDGVDEETKVLMQDALNVGDNGKNRYKHIYYCST